MSGKPVYPLEARSQAVSLYRSGLSMNAAAKRIGTTCQIVRRWLLSAGLTLRADSIKPRHPPATRVEAERLYRDEQTPSQLIADRLKVDRSTVLDWLHAAKLVRTMSEAAALSIARGATRGRSLKIHWHSSKTGRVEFADSAYEAARMRQLDRDPLVLSWSRCRDAIPYVAGCGKTRRYMPDFCVRYADGAIVEEVKPEKFLSLGDNQIKFAAALARYGEAGFRIVTEREIELSSQDYAMFRSMRLDATERAQVIEAKRHERLATLYATETPAQQAARRQRQNEKASRQRARKKASMTLEQFDKYRAQLNADARQHYRQRQSA